MAADTRPLASTPVAPTPLSSTAAPASGPDLSELDLTEPDAPLRSFAVLALLTGPDLGGSDPVQVVQTRLADAGLHPQDVQPLRQSESGQPEVRVRFVEASLDGETAVRGLDATLREAGLPVDEVWLDHQLD
jgi:hypothetical protein